MAESKRAAGIDNTKQHGSKKKARFQSHEEISAAVAEGIAKHHTTMLADLEGQKEEL